MIYLPIQPPLRSPLQPAIGGVRRGGAATTVATPQFSPAAGSYGPTQNVTITTSTVGATIYYTTDGSDPDAGDTQYTTPIEVAATTTIKAIAIDGVLIDSAIASATYTINGAVATPAISPAAATYNDDQSVTITCATGGAAIYYTTDGSTPDATKTLYTVGFALSASATVKAIGIKAGFSDSAVASNAIVLQVATPTFNPVAGTYGSTQNVTISTTTTGDTIRYTVDGSTPDGSSTVYSGAISVAASQTVKAIGIKTGYSNSAVGSAAYVISAGPPATNLVYHWKLNTGLTQAGGFASAWVDEIAALSLAQATGTNQPAVQGDGSLLFDGADNFMKTAAFTQINAPLTICARMKQITWTAADKLIAGNSNAQPTLIQSSSTPTVAIRAVGGADVAANTAMTLNTWKSVVMVFDGANSVLRIDGTETTGDPGAAALTAFTLGSTAAGTSAWANCQFAEVLIYNSAKDATARAGIEDYLDAVVS